MFLHPIDLEEAPDYYEVVSQPMDVETIRAKNDSREYEDLDAFRKDVALVLDNAKVEEKAMSYEDAVKPAEQGEG